MDPASAAGLEAAHHRALLKAGRRRRRTPPGLEVPGPVLTFPNQDSSNNSPRSGPRSSRESTTTYFHGVMSRPSSNRNNDVFTEESLSASARSSGSPSPSSDTAGLPSSDAISSNQLSPTRPAVGVIGPDLQDWIGAISTPTSPGSPAAPGLPGGLDANTVLNVSVHGRINYRTGRFELRSFDMVPSPSSASAVPNLRYKTPLSRGGSWHMLAGQMEARRGASSSAYDRAIGTRAAWRAR